MASKTGSSTGGAESECEGEEQEDPSSSFHSGNISEVRDALNQLTVAENTQESQNRDGEDELAAFRQQWQRELESTPSPRREQPPKQEVTEPVTDEDKAKQLFLRGVDFERAGKLYEAIQHYKRAMQIVPDIETRLYNSDLRSDSPQEEEEIKLSRVNNENVSDDEDAVEGEDLVARFQRILARKGALCEQEFDAKGAHISWLPYEVILLVLRWVVSSELDAMSLERVSAVSRGLYVAARDSDIWRSLCVKTWGRDCGSLRASGSPSWRHMFVERPRLQLHGCYISKTTYLRHGENSFQDQFYRPWYLVEYYRYLRFFSDGVALMWTTAEEPAACVAHLKHRLAKSSLGIMAGHYRLVGDMVVIVVKKSNSEKKPAQTSNTRFRARRKDVAEPNEQTYHLELQLRGVRSRRNQQLVWRRYAVAARRDLWTQFDLAPGKFPPFAFSRVRNYTAEALAPLPRTIGYS